MRKSSRSSVPWSLLRGHLHISIGVKATMVEIMTRILTTMREKRYPTPIYSAIELQMPTFAMELLQQPVQIHSLRGPLGTPLQVAAYYGYHDVVKSLLCRDADANTSPGEFGTALYAASSQNHNDVVGLLVSEATKLDVDATGGPHGTALQCSCFLGHTEIVSLLLGSDANPNVAGGHFGDALQAASTSGHVEIVQILLESGANVDVFNGALGSAYSAAVYGNHTEIENVLIKAGGPPSQEGRIWKTAIDKSFLREPNWTRPHLMHYRLMGSLDVALAPMQRLSAGIIEWTTPLIRLKDALEAHFHGSENHVFREVQKGFNRGRQLAWDGEQSLEHCDSRFFAPKHYFRAAVTRISSTFHTATMLAPCASPSSWASGAEPRHTRPTFWRWTTTLPPTSWSTHWSRSSKPCFGCSHKSTLRHGDPRLRRT
ncbi:ankyrin repeat-containing domain protein [Massariosphaeria phaeospora]|uniref:Ankyrin repeat-containing domain protein n=1 Tax=Massariosphaeria phaeospora TaxID=100035 RepID=A0A7C8MDM3_9PLEO|nr:ankyrin repeat-containing domain protein [Massariosphaeria phaeospora]